VIQFSYFSQSHNAGVVLSLDDSIRDALFDEGRIKQMVINILKNAIDAIALKGSIEIATCKKGKVLCLSFKDDGCGISEAHINHIFDMYFTTKEVGSGLGLMLVYNTVKDHGGRIEVISHEGEGTEMRVMFPLRRDSLRLPKGGKK